MSRLDQAADLLHSSGLGALLRRVGPWRGTLVLTYHRIGHAEQAEGDRAGFSATPEEFSAQLDLLARHTEVVGPEDVADGGRRLGRRVLITFDDGYRDNHAEALPRLKTAGLTASFFVSTGFLDRPRMPWWDEIAWLLRRDAEAKDPLHDAERDIDAALATYKSLPSDRADALLDEIAERTGQDRAVPGPDDVREWMTWDMVRDLVASGMTVGGHTVDHAVLARADPDRQADEIHGCAARLESELGSSMRWFAYPVGTPDTFTPETERIVAASGAQGAFELSGGLLPPGRPKNPFAIPRTSVGPAMRPSRFPALLTLPQRYARW